MVLLVVNTAGKDDYNPTTGFPTDITWISPSKTWISNYQAGETATQTLFIRTDSTTTLTMLVETVDGDDGVLELHLDVPLLLDGKSPFVIKSQFSKENPRLKSYNPSTQVATITGFAPVATSRIVEFMYTPAYMTYTFYAAPPMGTDSRMELVDPPEFVPIDNRILAWVTLACNGTEGVGSITMDLLPNEVYEVAVTLAIPEDTEVPEHFEFRIGSGIARPDTPGTVVGAEMNYKFLVSNGKLRLATVTAKPSLPTPVPTKQD